MMHRVQARKLPNGLMVTELVDNDTEKILATASTVADIEPFKAAMRVNGYTQWEVTEIAKDIENMSQTELLPAPLGWKADELSATIADAQSNARIFFYGEREYFKLYSAIYDVHLKVVEGSASPHEIAGILFIQAGATYASAVHLAVSLQLSQAYMVLRGCLENYLYGFYLMKRPDLLSVWENRNDGEEALRMSRRTFQIGPMFEELGQSNPEVRDLAKTLYDRMIDAGAHPNPAGLFSNIVYFESEGQSRVAHKYFNDDSRVSGLCFQATAEVGFAGLLIMGEVLRERFVEFGLGARLEAIRTKILRLGKSI